MTHGTIRRVWNVPPPPTQLEELTDDAEPGPEELRDWIAGRSNGAGALAAPRMSHSQRRRGCGRGDAASASRNWFHSSCFLNATETRSV